MSIRLPRASIVRRFACGAAVAIGAWAAGSDSSAIASNGGVRPGMVRVPSGTYVPLYALPAPATGATGTAKKRGVAVPAFDMDVHPVTNGEYLDFVRARPEWRRSRVAALFADESYLRHWRGDLDPGDQAPAASPVVYVSWFAARAYLKAAGKALPTIDQWEYAAAGRNTYGVKGLHGPIREWTLDFNSSLVTGESRADSALERTLYCGSGAMGASNFEDYAAFMRFAYRSSLEARYAVANLSFRGVLQPTRRTP